MSDVLAADTILKPHYRNRAEKLADGWVHGVGLVLAIGAGATAFGLSIWRGDAGQAVAVLIYALSMVTMLACSTAYNMTEDPARKKLLRRFDHAAIFLMIAGSYTPFTTQRFEGGWAVWMTTAVWAIAVAGMAGKLFLPGLSKKLWVGLYVVLGWMVVIAIQPMIERVSMVALILLVIGGAIYTLGVPIYVSERAPFRRAIWHGFIIVAAGVHYAAVLIGVVFAANS
jgi:hemolysin III